MKNRRSIQSYFFSSSDENDRSENEKIFTFSIRYFGSIHHLIIINQLTYGRRRQTVRIMASTTSFTTEKRGHFYCGFCCDVRRAVIIINIITSISSVLMLLVSFLGIGIFQISDALIKSINETSYNATTTGTWNFTMNDDELNNNNNFTAFNATDASNLYNQLKEPAISSFFSMIFWSLISLILYIVIINGAIQYNWYTVSIGLIWSFVHYSMSLYQTSFDFFTFLQFILYVYPHYFLIVEIRNGTMSNENYRIREEYSCCCMTPRTNHYVQVIPSSHEQTTMWKSEMEMI